MLSGLSKSTAQRRISGALNNQCARRPDVAFRLMCKVRFLMAEHCVDIVAWPHQRCKLATRWTSQLTRACSYKDALAASPWAIATVGPRVRFPKVGRIAVALSNRLAPTDTMPSTRTTFQLGCPPNDKSSHHQTLIHLYLPEHN